MPGTAPFARNGHSITDGVMQDGVAVIQLGPCYDSLDYMPLGGLSDLLERYAHAEAPPDVIIDMSETQSIGARFAGVLLSAARRLRGQRRRIALCGMNGFCADVLAAVHADEAFQVYSNREEALEAMSPA